MIAAYPAWLHLLAIASLSVGVVSAVTIALDEWRFPQRMGVMNLVWPVTALFGSVLWLGFYYAWGREVERDDGDPPMAVAVAKGSSHCGADCTLGDLLVEWTAFALPGLAAWFGFGTIFAERTFAVWIPDYLVAFLIGIAFQYFAIAPMRGLGLRDGLVAAVKADAASITA